MPRATPARIRLHHGISRRSSTRPRSLSPRRRSTGRRSQAIPPTLAWSAATDAASYRLQVASDSLFQFIAFEDTAVTGVSKQVSGTCERGALLLARQVQECRGRLCILRQYGHSPPNPWHHRSSVRPMEERGSRQLPFSPGRPYSGRRPITCRSLWQRDSVRYCLTRQYRRTRSGSVPSRTRPSTTGGSRARNAAGDTSAYPTSAWNFTTIVAGAGEPTLVAPADGAKSIPQTAASFSWNTVIDATSYRLADLNRSCIRHRSLSRIPRSPRPHGTVTNLQTATQYFWRVSAKNAAGISPFSETRSFTTNLAQPSIIAPANAAMDQTRRADTALVIRADGHDLLRSGFAQFDIQRDRG